MSVPPQTIDRTRAAFAVEFDRRAVVDDRQRLAVSVGRGSQAQVVLDRGEAGRHRREGRRRRARAVMEARRRGRGRDVERRGARGRCGRRWRSLGRAGFGRWLRRRSGGFSRKGKQRGRRGVGVGSRAAQLGGEGVQVAVDRQADQVGHLAERQRRLEGVDVAARRQFAHAGAHDLGDGVDDVVNAAAIFGDDLR